MRLRSRLQDLESVLGLYDIFEARKCDGRNGEHRGLVSSFFSHTLSREVVVICRTESILTMCHPDITGLIKWNIHLYDYLQAIYEALFSVEGALQVVKNHRETTGATEKTADKVVAVWRNWQNNFQSAFTKEQISHFGKLRGSERELSLGRRAADVGQYLTRALRACVYRLRGHVNWKWWADKDVKKVEEELLAGTSALRNS